MTHHDLDCDSSPAPWSGQTIAPQLNWGGNFFFFCKEPDNKYLRWLLNSAVVRKQPETMAVSDRNLSALKFEFYRIFSRHKMFLWLFFNHKNVKPILSSDLEINHVCFFFHPGHLPAPNPPSYKSKSFRNFNLNPSPSCPINIPPPATCPKALRDHA